MKQKTKSKRSKKLIKMLGLSPHPEGGHYNEVHRSKSKLISPKIKKSRNALTDIYFLLTSGQISRFHKVCHDEVWNFYEGAPLALFEIQPDTLKISKITLGDKKGKLKYKHCISGENWQAAYSTGEYSLVGCTVAPGFDFSDFKFLKDDKRTCSAIQKQSPKLSYLI